MIENDEVLSLLQGKNTLRDATLDNVEIVSTLGVPHIIFKFKPSRYSDFESVTIIFHKVVEFDLGFIEGNSFLDIWDLKFIKLEDNSFYVSLDPDPETLASAGCLDIKPERNDGFTVRAYLVLAETTSIISEV